MLSRRQLLAGAAGVVAATGAGIAAPELWRRVGGAPESPHPIPTGPRGAHEVGSFRSAAMGRTIRAAVAYPALVQRDLPFLLVLHGRGGDYRTAFRDHHLDAFLSDAVRRGVPPFAVVTVDGGDHSYWHRRANGQDPQRMILSELLPRLRVRGLLTGRFALGGWSMGGYGALLLAERLGRQSVAAVVPDSPAIWERWQDSGEDAFDGPEDFAANDVLTGTSRLEGIPVRVTCGTSDPLLPGVESLLRRLPAAQRELGPGGHDRAWWQHAAPAQLAFAGHALALG